MPTKQTFWTDLIVLVGIACAIGVANLRLRSPAIAWLADPADNPSACEATSLLDLPTAPRVTAAELKQLIERHEALTLIDARSPNEYLAGHLPGATSLPAEAAASLLEVQSLPIAPDTLVVTYCNGGTCEVSEGLAYLLVERAGCQRVKVLEGGFLAWQSAGYLLETGVSTDQSQRAGEVLP